MAQAGLRLLGLSILHASYVLNDKNIYTTKTRLASNSVDS